MLQETAKNRLQLVVNKPLSILDRIHPSANFHNLMLQQISIGASLRILFTLLYPSYVITIAIINICQTTATKCNMCIIIICRMTLYFFSRILSILLSRKTISFLMSRIKKLFHPIPFLSFSRSFTMHPCSHASKRHQASQCVCLTVKNVYAYVFFLIKSQMKRKIKFNTSVFITE